VKKYLLPTLVSLALSAPVLLAEEMPNANREATPPMLAKPPENQVAPPADMMQKDMEKRRAEEEKMRQEHVQRMQDERQRFLQSRLMELQQQMKEIQAMIDAPPPEMNGERGNMPNGMGMPNGQGNMPNGMGMPNGMDNRPRWGGQPPMHGMMGPGGPGMDPRRMDRMQQNQPHHQRMEALLQRIVDLLEQMAGEKAK